MKIRDQVLFLDKNPICMKTRFEYNSVAVYAYFHLYLIYV